MLIESGLTVTPTDLAAALMTAVEQDSNPHGLANRAINSLRQRIQVRRSMMNVLAPDAGRRSAVRLDHMCEVARREVTRQLARGRGGTPAIRSASASMSASLVCSAATVRITRR